MIAAARLAGIIEVWLAMALWLTVSGCSTPDVNPRVAHSNTGYVDFYTDANEGLSWEVKRASEPGGEMRIVFSEFKPRPSNILRLTAPAGVHRFEVWFQNRVTTGPQSMQVQVADGKVTPVRIQLTPAGLVSVQNSSTEYRPTTKATRRVTRHGTDQQQTYHIGAEPGEPQAYQLKEQMPYYTLTK